MRTFILSLAIVSMGMLTGCITRHVNIYVPAEMLVCPGDVVPPGQPGQQLTDNEIAEVIEKLDARGDICAGKLEALRQWLTRRGAVVENPASPGSQ